MTNSNVRQTRLLALSLVVLGMTVMSLSACEVANPRTTQYLTLKSVPLTRPSRTMAYGADPLQLFDVYVPFAWKAADTRPVIVFVHGGGWNGGSRSDVSAVVKSQLLRGWVVISVGYRLTPAVTFPEPVRDIDRAVRFIRARAKSLGINPNQLVLSGHSAGGHLAMIVAMGDGQAAFVSPDLTPEMLLQSSRPQAVVTLGAPLDLTAFASENWQAIPNILNMLLGCDASRPFVMTCASEQLATASANYLIDQNDPPVLLIHGMDDPIVSVDQAYNFRQMALDHGLGSKIWMDIVDSGPMQWRQHWTDMALNFDVFKRFIDLGINGGFG